MDTTTIDGSLVRRSRSRILRLVLGVTGILLARAVLAFIATYLLGLRRPCTVRAGEAGVAIESSTFLLGRAVRTVTTRIPPWKIDRVDREDRFRHAHVLAGALFFLLGTAGGFCLLVEWAWTRFGLYIVVGLLAIALGIAVDLAVVALVPAARGRSAVVIHAGGTAYRVEGVLDSSADRFTSWFEDLVRERGAGPAAPPGTREEGLPRGTPT